METLVDIPTAYGEALLCAGEIHTNLVVLDADLQDSCHTEAFHRRFPSRAFDLGIAEQSLITFAAGLALNGKIPICNTFAVFAVGRAFDQLRQSVAYNRANVKVVGHAAGLSLGYAGPSHHALEDVALMRTLPHMVVLCPVNDVETREMVRWMVEYDGPVYLRLIRTAGPPVLPADYRFQPERLVSVLPGNDLTLFTSGDLAALGTRVHEKLRKEGIAAEVVHVPMLKPLPVGEIIAHGGRTKAAVVIEDHSVIGGLGEAICGIYAESLRKPVRRVGIRDAFTESDDRDVLLDAYSVSVEAVVEEVRKLSLGRVFFRSLAWRRRRSMAP